MTRSSSEVSNLSASILLFVIVLVGMLLWHRRHAHLGVRLDAQRSETAPHPGGEYRARPDAARSRDRRAREEPCKSIGILCDSVYFSVWQAPRNGSCSVIFRNGYPLPDPRCTPGGIEASVNVDTLRDPQWRTRCVRNCESSEEKKQTVYRWYGISRPKGNTGTNQICELDHLVPLELGGADGMANIWPECGPSDVLLEDRYFVIKNRVESYLANQVKAGRIQLSDAQRGIAEDWTQYIEAADLTP
jgi:hypothetical protein